MRREYIEQFLQNEEEAVAHIEDITESVRKQACSMGILADLSDPTEKRLGYGDDKNLELDMLAFDSRKAARKQNKNTREAF